MTIRASRSFQRSKGRSTISKKQLSCTTKGADVVQDRALIILRRRSLNALHIRDLERSSFTDRDLSCPTKGADVVQDRRSYAA